MNAVWFHISFMNKIVPLSLSSMTNRKGDLIRSNCAIEFPPKVVIVVATAASFTYSFVNINP